ncbi:unnamed protein product, partial [Didymodactylos carnosus]
SLKLDRWYEYVNAANPEESESEPEPQTPNLIDMEEDDDVPKTGVGFNSNVDRVVVKLG